MAAITVRIGREDKEISGLSRKTTCLEVLQALLKDKQTSSNFAAETNEDEQFDLEISNKTSKGFRELAENYVIVENWRGCEKPLPPQTRILLVWEAWGKEQCHVKFALKKDKNYQFRANRLRKDDSSDRYNNLINIMSQGQAPPQADSTHFPPKLSHGQKKRIRRNIMQYQRAVLSQHTKENLDSNNNSGKQSRSTERITNSAGDRSGSYRQKATETSNSVTLSEEQFVDGVVTGPECLLRHEGKSKFIRTALDSKDFNRERCTYRRPHHRRRSLMLEDSEVVSDQKAISSPLRDHETHQLPPSRKSKRQTSSRHRRHGKRHGRVSKHSRKHRMHSSRYSTDSTTTSTGTPSTASEIDCESHSDGEDADDEKSIMTEFGTLLSRQKLCKYPGSLLPCIDSYSSETASASNATATDSSSGTTTCSETSNISSFSGTSSSETSSSADIYNESFFAKRAAAAAAAATKASASSEKSKAAKLFRKVAGPSLTKPAQSLIGSFKKKKKTTQISQASNITKHKSPSQDAVKLGSKPVLTKEQQPTVHQKVNISDNAEQTLATNSSNCTKAKTEILVQERQRSPKTSTEDSEAKAKLKQLVISQEEILRTNNSKEKLSDATIHRIESQVHRWRTQTHGKNYVQDTYLSGFDGSAEIMSEGKPQKQEVRSICSSTVSSQWVSECEDVKLLEEYLDTCQRVVDAQIHIEECKRNAEILLQDMRDEVWKATGDANSTPRRNSLTAAALGLVAEDGDSSEDENDSPSQCLSVSSGKNKVSTSSAADNVDVKNDTADGNLEIERSRTELEANLYLSLRLSAELDEVDQLMCTSQRLLQAKGENLLSLVRELAHSPEGISSELWKEYGELLMAYDAEVSLQHHLAACAQVDNANRIQFKNDKMKIESSPSLITLTNNTKDADTTSPTTSALHHALSPWLWCEHCKLELEMQQQGNFATSEPMPPHWLSHSAIPPKFSDLPLPTTAMVIEPPPSPSVRHIASMTQLLPMPPIPDSNDSDYDEIPEKEKTSDVSNSTTSAIISTEDAIPRGMMFRHHPSPVPNSTQIKDLLSSARNNSASNTDDSGNASAESTASFASTNSDSASTDTGSRNSSCDGGSPRPPFTKIENQDSAHSSPFFLRGNTKKGNKAKFTFPSNIKFSHDDALKSSKGSRSPPKINLPINRSNFLLKQSIIKPSIVSSAPASPADGNKSLSSSLVFDRDRMEQQKRLIRRNSGRTKRTAPIFPEAFARRATSFGKGGLRPNALPSHLSGVMRQPIVYNSHCDLVNSRNDKNNVSSNMKNKHLRNCPSPLNLLLSSSRSASPLLKTSASAPCSPLVGGNLQRIGQKNLRRPNQLLVGDFKKSNLIISDNAINSYDNDSDTGLSSLHSTDSFDKLNMYSETLV